MDALNQALVSVVYTPDADWFGRDRVVLAARDGAGRTPVATTLVVDVEPVNDTPTIVCSGAVLIQTKKSQSKVAGGLGSDAPQVLDADDVNTDVRDVWPLELTLKAARGNLTLEGAPGIMVMAPPDGAALRPTTPELVVCA